jgi:hypothetical protein
LARLDITGPDGSGKSALAEALKGALRASGYRVVHSHGRPQLILRRGGLSEDVSNPHSRPPRGIVGSLAKIAITASDFLLGRIRYAKVADVWIAERPPCDMVVDPIRYQLDSRVVPLIAWLSRRMRGQCDVLVVLVGDSELMATRKGELPESEVARQVNEWHHLAASIRGHVMLLDSTSGSSPVDLAEQVKQEMIHDSRRWFTAPVKPRRLDVRLLGADVAALDIYRPIRYRASLAARLGRVAARAGLTPQADAPRIVEDVLMTRPPGYATGIAAMRSSTQGRWICGIAVQGTLEHVVKVGSPEDEGIAREAANLRLLKAVPPRGFRVPAIIAHEFTAQAQGLFTSALGPGLSSVTDVDMAIELATELASEGWTHGDFAHWNIFITPSGEKVVLDWEEATPHLVPLADIVHYLMMLGNTIDTSQAKTGIDDLLSAGPRFAPLLSACGIDKSPVFIARAILAQVPERSTMDTGQSRTPHFGHWIHTQASSVSRGDAL